jgi:hypothetical protein
MFLLVLGDASAITRHVSCAQSGAECGLALQRAIDQAPAGATITLDAGRTYEGTFVIPPRHGASAQTPLTITTRGWSKPGSDWDALVTPADKGHMAVLRAPTRSNVVIDIPPASGAGYVNLVGLAFEATRPAGQGDLIRIGSGSEGSIANVPRHVAIRQVLIQGSRDFGQKRGIAANGTDIDIGQVWCEEVFIAGQDNQCVAGWNGGKRVRIHHSYLAAGAENILIGGAPVVSAEMQLEDWTIEDVILHKPLRWKEDGRNRTVKNLLEFKHGRRLTARRVLAVNNWRAGQAGNGLLLTYKTNGPCPACGNLQDVLIEDFVMLNVDAGISLQGYSYQPESRSDGKLLDVTLRHVYAHLSTPGRAIQITNIRGRHNVRIERSTIINHGTTWVLGSFGRAWQDADTLVDGGAMQGLWLIDNLFAANGRYGISAPEQHHYGRGLALWADDDLQISGNVIGGAPDEHLANYNKHHAPGPRNVSASRDDVLARLPARACGEWAAGKGAECARLQPIFEWLGRLPEP